MIIFQVLFIGRGMQSDDHESFFFRSLAGNVSRLMPRPYNDLLETLVAPELQYIGGLCGLLFKTSFVFCIKILVYTI